MYWPRSMDSAPSRIKSKDIQGLYELLSGVAYNTLEPYGKEPYPVSKSTLPCDRYRDGVLLLKTCITVTLLSFGDQEEDHSSNRGHTACPIR